MNQTVRAVKALLKPLHTWTGIIAGLILAVTAVTGSLIVFRAEFERAAFPKGAAAQSSARVTLDQAAAEVARLRPNGRIRRVRLPLDSQDPYIFQVESGKHSERIVSNASSGRVVGALETGTLDWLVDLHRNFLSGATGRKAVGFLGILLFVLSTTGVLMWLAGPRHWRSWISVRGSGTSRRFHFELHRASGLWAYAFLTLISFTGIELAFPDTFRNTVKAITGQPVTVRAPRQTGVASTLSLDEYMRAGRAALPDGVAIELRLPPPGRGPVDLRLYRAGDFSPSGNHVYLDPATARVIQVDRVVDRPLGARFLAAFSPIHYGQVGGTAVKIAWGLFGLAPVLLMITGLVAWWRPSKKKAKQAEPKEAGEDLALAGR